MARQHRRDIFDPNEVGAFHAVPTESERKLFMTSVRCKQLRSRVSDISWWMRALAEPIARRSKIEDKCTGRFWEGHFKCQKLVDETAILACSAYVDRSASFFSLRIR